MKQREHSNDVRGFPFVAIVSVNWNGWSDTLECLESVRRLDYLSRWKPSGAACWMRLPPS